MKAVPNRRILVVDDMTSIHEDFRKIFTRVAVDDDLSADEAVLFGEPRPVQRVQFEVDCVHQGQEALERVVQSCGKGQPYAVAFVDMRMPPGWDGVETTYRVWQVDKAIQIVICTAYSDVSWDEVLERLDARDRLVILKKPFDAIEALQLATSLCAKWDMAARAV